MRARCTIFSILCLLQLHKEVEESGRIEHPLPGHFKPQESNSLDIHFESFSTDVRLTPAMRAAEIRQAALHSYHAYERYAFGTDELKPVTLEGDDTFGGFGVTIVDSLDTLLLMGMQPEVSRALHWISTSLHWANSVTVSLFELNIRLIGGLLGGYYLTNNSILLDKAADLAKRFLPAFDAPSGLPVNHQDVSDVSPKKAHTVSLAEVGSFTVEFVALSAETNNSQFAEVAEAVVKKLIRSFPDQGLLPSVVLQSKPEKVGNTHSQLFTFGAPADSYYEYLLKTWVLKGKQDEEMRAAWERSIDDVMQWLLFNEANATFIGLAYHDSKEPVPRQEHLACFLPGNIILGLMHHAVSVHKRQLFLNTARRLMKGCALMYAASPTGLAPDAIFVSQHGSLITPSEPQNALRPEVVESLFYMWRYTHNRRYRKWAWGIFKAFEKFSRVPESGAYSGITNAWLASEIEFDNLMPSFWLSETLKYLWLIFQPDDVLDLQKWVLNTEAHLIRIPHHTSHV